MENNLKLSKATFGGGCFWCTEALFQQLKGVQTVTSGYAGGEIKNPTYEQICTGTTGHAEVIQLAYDENAISYSELLEIFWKTHNPTTLNQQGADRGTQYRSVIFYHSQEQKNLAKEMKNNLDRMKIWTNGIVTEISEAPEFYPAEKYHQNYYNTNGAQNGYCQIVIAPKVEKFKTIFGDKLK
jgi:peptide-methionine (S)-S-oxide reductase